MSNDTLTPTQQYVLINKLILSERYFRDLSDIHEQKIVMLKKDIELQSKQINKYEQNEKEFRNKVKLLEDDKQNLQKIKEAMINKKFIDLMKYLAFKEDNKYNYKIIALFKKDFYKYFLPKQGNKSVSLPKKHKSNKLHKRNKSI